MARKVRAKVNLQYDSVYREKGDEFYLIVNDHFNGKAMEWADKPMSKELQKELAPPAIIQAARPVAVPDDAPAEVPALPDGLPVATPPESDGKGTKTVTEKKGTGDQSLI